jgi:hypothetical protein
MEKFSRQQLQEALDIYNHARDESSRTGDWSIWAAVFTEDAQYIEHAFGEFRGRAAIREWITKVMAPFPHMTFPQDWVAFDEEHGAIVFQCQNRLEHPADPNGEPFHFPTWTRLIYAGDGLFASEEDVYNPLRDAAKVVSAWGKAGGKFASPPLVDMRYR